MDYSSIVINPEYFENLWLSIMQEKCCDVTSVKNLDFFIPERKFDKFWAHATLSANDYKNYGKIITLGNERNSGNVQEMEVCPFFKKFTEENDLQVCNKKPYYNSRTDIIPITKQLETIERNKMIRKKLANDFINRKTPWYLERDCHINEFDFNENFKKIFTKTFEYDLIYNIYLFGCRIIIIDVGLEVELKDLERWQKFAPYVRIITVVHSHVLFQQLSNLPQIFQAVLFEEIDYNLWQQELERAIKVGLQFAKSLHLYDNASEPFAFVFSTIRGLCTCDKFKILRAC